MADKPTYEELEQKVRELEHIEIERKHAENEFQENEKRYRTFINATPDMVYLKDELFRNIVVNQCYAAFLGKPEGEIIGKNDFELMPQIAAEKCRQTDMAALASTSVIISEEIAGDQVYETNKFQVGLGNNSTGVGGFIRNITERKQVEEELRVNRILLRTVLDIVPVFICAKNLDGKFLLVNKKLTDFYGSTVEAMTNVIHADLCEDQNELRAMLIADREVIESGKPKFIPEETMKNPDGSIIVLETYKIPFTAQGEPAVLITSNDTTERKQAEEETAKLQAQLTQAQKMDSIGNLAGGIAHDFNNILSAILGFTELAIDGMDRDSDDYDHLKEVMTAGNRAKELVQQILSFSRQAEHEMKTFNISRLVNEVHKMLRSTIPSSIAIDVDNQAERTVILGDFTRLHQVLLNLCTNASHAMEDEGGTLEIGLRNISFDEENKDLLPGDYVQLTVSDTGIGIAPKIINRIFEPYFTTKEKGKGTGMGLAVVHGIIKSHNGNVTVYSEPEKGTTFNVYLPLVNDAGRDVSVQPKKIIATGDERILFVDDEPSIVKLQQQSLERMGYRIVVKTDSLEALETFKAAPDAFDLVITDMTMPDMTGDCMAREIKRIRPDIPVILCTGFSGKLSRQAAEKLQIDKLVMKPVDKAEMSKAIREVLDKAKGGVQ